MGPWLPDATAGPARRRPRDGEPIARRPELVSAIRPGASSSSTTRRRDRQVRSCGPTRCARPPASRPARRSPCTTAASGRGRGSQLAAALLEPGWSVSTSRFSATDRRESGREPRRRAPVRRPDPCPRPGAAAGRAPLGRLRRRRRDADPGQHPDHRLSTPNKLFEAFAAGVPVVVSDFLGMRGIVLEDPGRTAGERLRPGRPGVRRRAIRSILDLSPEERAGLRRAASGPPTSAGTGRPSRRISWSSTGASDRSRDRRGERQALREAVPQRASLVLPSSGALTRARGRYASAQQLVMYM